MTAVKSPTKTPPKKASAKPATGKRRLTRDPASHPQSGAPAPIDGQEIVRRVAGMFPRNMNLAQAAELARGLAWAYGAASMHLAVQAGISGDLVDTLASEVHAAAEDGQRQVLAAMLRAEKKEQAA